MEETIDLRELFGILRKHLALMVILGFIFTVAAGAISYFFMTPIYSVSTQLIVSRARSDDIIQGSEIQANIQLINTFNDVLMSPAILDQVIDELDLNMTAGGLRGKMSVNNATNSQVMTMTVQDEDPHLAREIANAVAERFQNDLPDIMNVDNVSILAQAEVAPNMRPINPRPMINMAIAGMVGVMLGVGLAFLFEFLDKTVKTEQDVEKLIGLPVLGAIPTITAEDMTSKSGKASQASEASQSRE